MPESSSENASLGALEVSVDRLVEALHAERARVRSQRVRIEALGADLDRLEAGAREPARLHRELKGAEARIEALETRLREAREAVDRLLSRVRFLEDQSR
jgi:predicted RNase H-like nuclease (RuvC/YqgF family)